MSRKLNEWPEWPSERAWIGIGIFSLTIMILWMIKQDPSLRNDEFFKTIATAIIITGFINGVISWAYSATQGGTELARSNADLLQRKEEKQPDASGAEPKPVLVVNDEAIPVEEQSSKNGN